MKELAAIKATKKNADSKKRCVNMPLINIEPCDCIIDELHLFLRISDKLFDSFLPRWKCQQCCGTHQGPRCVIQCVDQD